MKNYIYPENLRSTLKLWFWNMRDFCIICGGIILSVFLFAQLWTVVPLAVTACFAFVAIRTEELSILDYMLNAAKYFFASQQSFSWKKHKERISYDEKE